MWTFKKILVARYINEFIGIYIMISLIQLGSRSDQSAQDQLLFNDDNIINFETITKKNCMYLHNNYIYPNSN